MKTKNVMFFLVLSFVFIGCRGWTGFNPVLEGITEHDFAPGHEDVVTSRDIDFLMVYVPPGSFRMGWADNPMAKPVHTVDLTRGYWLGKMEVTNALGAELFSLGYRMNNWIVEEGLLKNNRGEILLDLNEFSNIGIYHGYKHFYVIGGKENYPLTGLTWYGALTLCNLLSRDQGLAPVYNEINWSADYSQNGYRLPTEAEWEFAARYIDGHNFTPGDTPGGVLELEDVDTSCWYYDNTCDGMPALCSPRRVGTKKPTPLGFFDLGGNVWEWCGNVAEQYGYLPEIDPSGPVYEVYNFLIVRGGSWSDKVGTCGSSMRRLITPLERCFTIGLRLARNE